MEIQHVATPDFKKFCNKMQLDPIKVLSKMSRVVAVRLQTKRECFLWGTTPEYPYVVLTKDNCFTFTLNESPFKPAKRKCLPIIKNIMACYYNTSEVKK